VSDPADFFEEDPEEGALNPREKPMGFFDHLEELRWTLVRCVAAYLVFAIAIAVYLREFKDLLMWPLLEIQRSRPDFALDLGTMSVMESFSVALQMCTLGALGPAAPFIIYFLGKFVAPALNEKELKLVLPIGIAAMLLFVLGATFSFYLLVPSTIKVSVELNELLGFVPRWTAGSYFSLVTWLVLGVGLAFEFPLIIVLLVYMGMLTVETLRRYRRHAIVTIFIIAAIVTPTPDPFTQTIFAVPLYLLFEIAVIVAARVQKRRQIAA
jgi:sec-independent protein translocase protein TatC